jgi:hypothetical protein
MGEREEEQRQHCEVVADVDRACFLNGAGKPDGEADDGDDVGPPPPVVPRARARPRARVTK